MPAIFIIKAHHMSLLSLFDRLAIRVMTAAICTLALTACNQPSAVVTPQISQVYFGNQPQLIIELDASATAGTEKQADELASDSVIKRLNQLTDLAWRLPYATRVESLVNLPISSIEDDNFIITTLRDELINDNGLQGSKLLRSLEKSRKDVISRFVEGDRHYIYVTFTMPSAAETTSDTSIRDSLLDFIFGARHCIERREINAVVAGLNDWPGLPSDVALSFHSDFIEGASIPKPQLLYISSAFGENGLEAEQLRQLRSFSEWLALQSEVSSVETFIKPIAQLSLLSDGEDILQATKESELLFSQFLLLYEMSLSYGSDLDNQLAYVYAPDSPRHSAYARIAKLAVTLKAGVDVDDFQLAADKWLGAHTPDLHRFMQEFAAEKGLRHSPLDAEFAGYATTAPAKLQCAPRG